MDLEDFLEEFTDFSVAITRFFKWFVKLISLGKFWFKELSDEPACEKNAFC